jgi:hypothetical protein
VGNYGYDIEITRNLNALPNQYLNADNSRSAAMNANNTFLTTLVTNPFAGMLPGTSFNNATIARSQLMLPFPEFGAVTTTNNDGKSWYSSGQFGLQKRFSDGYAMGVSYTYSKWNQATEYLNAADPTPTKMISDLDVTNRLSINGIYALPFGKGQKFLSDAGGVIDALLGGWQAQGVYTYQTGFPIAFATDAFYNGGEIALPANQRTVAQWFNTGAFTSLLTDPAANNSTPVNHLRTLPMRFSDVRRDSINSLDLSVIKNARFAGTKTVQLRIEFINVLDAPYFPAPVVTPATLTFGQVTASNQSNYPRRAQLGLRFTF